MSKSKDLIKKPAKWFALETIGNGLYDLIGLTWRSAIMTTALTIVVRFITAIPTDIRLIIGLFIVALAFFTLQLVIDKRRKKQTALPESETGETGQPVIENEKSIEVLNTQIEGLNQEIRKLQGNADTLQMCISSRDTELKQYEWLHNMANEQAKDIGRYVVAQVRYCFYELNAPIPYVNFAVDIRNNSVFDITIEEAIVGYIRLAGERLRGEKELVHHPKIAPSGEGSLTLKQRLTPEEGSLVAYCESQTLGAIYYFEELVIMIASRTEFPQFERTRLKLPQHIGSKDTPLSKEIDSLKAQLEEERAKRTKPDITGKISEVYSEWWAIAGQGDSKPMRFDYHFIVNVYLANHGAVTTIEQFKPVLKVGEHSCDGERERNIHDVKDDEMNWRAWGANELDDLEKSNDVPLEHTRNGWLWFVVKGVPNTEDKSEMKLELSVIDKDGTSYYLDTFPQPQWQDNPFLKKARMDEARARMRAQW